MARSRVAVADLVAAGLLDPLAASGDIAEIAGRSKAESDLAAMRQELAVTQARLTEANDEVEFLRELVRGRTGMA